ncbi:MAG: hypothetical protein AAFY67_22305, partial [Cyanobacteria bacterium J06642_9]
ISVILMTRFLRSLVTPFPKASNCLNIFDKHESLHTLQAKFEALGNGVTNDLKNRVIRITEIQAFRLRILKELATLACQSSGTDSSPE